MDVFGVFQTHEGPGFTGVQALVNASTAGVAVSRVAFPCARPDQIRVDRTQRHGANALGGLVVEHRLPGRPGAGALPQSAGGRPHVHHFRGVLRDGDGRDPSAHRARAQMPHVDGFHQGFDGVGVCRHFGLRPGHVQRAQRPYSEAHTGKEMHVHFLNFSDCSWRSGTLRVRPNALPVMLPRASKGTWLPLIRFIKSFFNTLPKAPS